MTEPTTDGIARMLANYEARHGRPSGAADMLDQALARGQHLTARNDYPVHVTCSAIARRPDGRVLQVHHRVLDRWLFPGGHIEHDDATLIDAARRELTEETSLTAVTIDDIPLDIDVHPIPANPDKGEPEHHHADFRYLAHIDTGDIVLQTDEVTNWRWATPDVIGNPAIAERLSSKAT